MGANFAARAEELDRRMRLLDSQYKTNFVDRGLLLEEFERDQLWKFLYDPFTQANYESFNRWLQDAAPWSERDCRYALGAVKQLKDVPADDLRQMPRVNVEVMKSLSSSVRTQPEVIQAAKTLPEQQFIEQIQKTHPDQHVEPRKAIRLVKSASEVVERAIRLAMAVEGIESRDEALEAIAVSYIQDHEQVDEQETA